MSHELFGTPLLLSDFGETLLQRAADSRKCISAEDKAQGRNWCINAFDYSSRMDGRLAIWRSRLIRKDGVNHTRRRPGISLSGVLQMRHSSFAKAGSARSRLHDCDIDAERSELNCESFHEALDSPLRGMVNGRTRVGSLTTVAGYLHDMTAPLIS